MTRARLRVFTPQSTFTHDAAPSPQNPKPSTTKPTHLTPSPNMITGIHHINLVVPASTLHLANEFYSQTLGLTPRPVPHLQRETLAWFDIGTSGQQVHVAIGKPEDFAHPSSRHPCFRVGSVEALNELQIRVWSHFERKGESESAPLMADKPGAKNSGAEGVEYPKRFFARDFAGNRLEFSV